MSKAKFIGIATVKAGCSLCGHRHFRVYDEFGSKVYVCDECEQQHDEDEMSAMKSRAIEVGDKVKHKSHDLGPIYTVVSMDGFLIELEYEEGERVVSGGTVDISIMEVVE